MSRLLLIVALFLSSVLVLAGPAAVQPAETLPPGAVARFGSVRLLHGPEVESLKFLADGKTLASCDEEKVRVWDVNTGRLQNTTPLPYAVSSPLLLPDGTVMGAFVPGPRPPTMVRRRAFGALGDLGALGAGLGALGALGAGGALAGGGGMIDSKAHFQAIDSRSGKVRFTLQGKVQSPPSFVSSPDGRFLANESGDQGVIVRELPGGKKVGRLKPPKGQRVGEMLFSPDGKLLVGLHHELTTVWDVEKQRQLASRELPGDSASRIAGAFSPDGQTLAVSWSRSVRLYDARTLTERKGFTPVAINCMALVFAADGKELIGVTEACHLVRWSMKGEQIGQPVQLKTGGRGWTVSNDAALLAFARDNGQIHLLDLKTGRERAIPQRRGVLADTVCLPSGQVATVTEDGEVVVWDPKDGQEISRKKLVDYHPKQKLRLSPDGRYALRYHSRSEHTVYEVHSGKAILDLADDDSVEFSPDGRLLLARNEKAWQLLNVVSGKVIHTIKEKNPDEDDSERADPPARILAFAPDGRTFALGGFQGVTVYEVATGRLRATPLVRRPGDAVRDLYLSHLVFSRDGKSLLIVGAYKLRVFSTVDWKLLWDFPFNREPYVIAVSADGRWLATADVEPTPCTIFIRDLWSRTPAKIVHELRGHVAELTSLGFTPDGKYLVSGSMDGTALVWDVDRFVAAVSRRVPPDETLLARWWNLLADTNPKAAGEAMQGFESFPTQAVSFFNTHLRPAKGPTPGRITALIRDLDAPRFATRQQAIQELEKLGELAKPELEAVLRNKPALEVQRRIAKLLDKLDEPLTDTERLRELRAVEVLERIGTAEAKKLLETLAGGAPEARLTLEAKASLRRLNPHQEHSH